MLLLTIFAVLAAGLAAVGIYGVIAFLVAQGTREMGIRMALGATPRGIGMLVLRHGLVIAAIGLALGVAGAFAVTRLMRSLLFGVRAGRSDDLPAGRGVRRRDRAGRQLHSGAPRRPAGSDALAALSGVAAQRRVRRRTMPENRVELPELLANVQNAGVVADAARVCDHPVYADPSRSHLPGSDIHASTVTRLNRSWLFCFRQYAGASMICSGSFPEVPGIPAADLIKAWGLAMTLGGLVSDGAHLIAAVLILPFVILAVGAPFALVIAGLLWLARLAQAAT